MGRTTSNGSLNRSNHNSSSLQDRHGQKVKRKETQESIQNFVVGKSDLLHAASLTKNNSYEYRRLSAPPKKAVLDRAPSLQQESVQRTSSTDSQNSAAYAASKTSKKPGITRTLSGSGIHGVPINNNHSIVQSDPMWLQERSFRPLTWTWHNTWSGGPRKCFQTSLRKP